jgi:hypothetical protein
MSTKLGEPVAASQTTHVAEMPPLEVVTEGIPPVEHIESAPGARVRRPRPVVREGWGRMWAWALAGVIGLLVVVVGVVAFTRYSSTGDADLTVVPPVGSDVGEPTSEPVYSGLLEGSALPSISDLSIPAIPSIAEVSIAPIPAISPMAAMTIPSIPDLAIPAMSIPDLSIPDLSIPEIGLPSARSTPSTAPFPAISFPSFPTIPSISVPSIPPFPEISIPPFPEISILPLAEISIPSLTDM